MYELSEVTDVLKERVSSLETVRLTSHTVSVAYCMYNRWCRPVCTSGQQRLVCCIESWMHGCL